MEPDPRIFLRAIRREALGEDLFGAGLSSGASQVIMQRTGECLAQLIIRNECLPGLVKAIRPSQVSILNAIAQRHKDLGVTPPESVSEAIDAAESMPSEPSEKDILLYDKIVNALSEGTHSLYKLHDTQGTDGDAFLINLLQDICTAETTLRKEYTIALEALKSAEGQDTSHEASPLPPPAPDELTAYLRHRFIDDPSISAGNIQRLVGDNSKDIFFFDISGSRHRNGSYVMRREPAYNVTRAALGYEYQLMEHLTSFGVPVPNALLGESDSSFFGGGFIITERLQGAPRKAEDLGPKGREILKDIARISAQIHRVSIPAELNQFHDAHLSTRERMLARVDNYYNLWMSERSESSAVIESAYHWLRINVSYLDDTPVLTHGDYNLRNFLLKGDRVSAILDWELCRISHPAEDLSYIRSDVEKVMPWDDYLATYLSASKITVNESALLYFECWSLFWMLVIGSSAYSGYHLEKHRNFIFASVACVEYRNYTATLARFIAEHPSLV